MTVSPSEQSRIVVGVDGSPQSDAALHWALRQAVVVNARVDAVACWRRPPMAAFAPLAWADMDLTEGTEREVQEWVARAVQATPGGGGVTVGTRVVEGYPARVLIEAAHGADLLVIGSRGHGEISGMALGSVSLHCASHAPCPVLIVRDGPEPVEATN